MSMIFYTKHERGLTIFADGKSAAVSDTHPQFAEILVALKNKEFDRARKMMTISDTINQAAQAVAGDNVDLRIFVKDGKVWFRDQKDVVTELEGSLVDRIITAISNGSTEQAILPLIKFLDNVMKNKLSDIRNELYLFMMSGMMPITKDGCFLAYKKVKDNFMDIYSGTMSNAPGKFVVMPKDQKVDTNRHNTCSHGLHFCTRSYLSNYGGSGAGTKVVIVKVNPRFVFAIPSDYQNAKGRASEYYVVGECTNDPNKEEAFKAELVFDENNMNSVAPTVKFVADLKPSLKSMAEGHGLSSNGQAWVRVLDGKSAPVPSAQYSIAKQIELGNIVGYVDAITGEDIPASSVKQMSIETKSVRAALTRAVAKCRHH